MRYIIIGNSAAGLSAAKNIRNIDDKANITIIGKEDFPAYGRPMISYYLKGKVTLDKLPIHNEDYYIDKKIDVLTDEVIEISHKDKKVLLASGKNISYDKLLIATGSCPFVPPLGNLGKQDNVYTFLDVSSAKALKLAVTKDSKVVILGGGLIALKAAEGLRGITSHISVVELADRILPTILNTQASNIVKDYIVDNSGITFYLSQTIKMINGDDRVESVELSDGIILDADILVIAVGVRPEITLARKNGINIGRGIIVDTHMMTSIQDIYAAGDVVECKDILDQSVKIMALWPNAVVGGAIAASNMAGVEKNFDGSFAYNAIDFFGLRMITGGIINPDENYEIKVIEDDKGYSMFTIKDDMLYGYILIGNVERAGLFTELIRKGYKLSTLNNILSDRTFLSYEKELRQAKYKGLDK